MPGHCLPDDNLSSDWLLSLHLAGTEQHQASHWTIISRSSHSLNTLVKTPNTFMLGIKYESYYICGQRSASSVSDVMGGYVLYQIRLLPFSRVISHNIHITIVNL